LREIRKSLSCYSVSGAPSESLLCGPVGVLLGGGQLDHSSASACAWRCSSSIVAFHWDGRTPRRRVALRASSGIVNQILCSASGKWVGRGSLSISISSRVLQGERP